MSSPPKREELSWSIVDEGEIENRSPEVKEMARKFIERYEVTVCPFHETEALRLADPDGTAFCVLKSDLMEVFRKHVLKEENTGNAGPEENTTAKAD